MKLEMIGKILSFGFGDKVLKGVILGLLNGVTPTRAYEYIETNKQLGYWASDNDWRKFKRMAKGANAGDITSEDIIKELRKSRPEILGIIINHPKGRGWLDEQIAEIKRKLELR